MWALMSNQGARRYLLWLKNRYVLTILEYVSWGHRWPAGGSHSYAWDHESGFCGNRSVPTALETAMWYSSAWTDPQYHLRKYIQGILCYRSVHITFDFFPVEPLPQAAFHESTVQAGAFYGWTLFLSYPCNDYTFTIQIARSYGMADCNGVLLKINGAPF